MEIYQVTFNDYYDDYGTRTKVFNDFRKASEFYNDLCCEFYKEMGVDIDISLCDFVDGELKDVFSVAHTIYD